MLLEKGGATAFSRSSVFTSKDVRCDRDDIAPGIISEVHRGVVRGGPWVSPTSDYAGMRCHRVLGLSLENQMAQATRAFEIRQHYLSCLGFILCLYLY